jgi:hypothetical protein
MIEIKAKSNKENKVTVSVKLDGHKSAVVKELFGILKALDENYPEILMNAVDLHMNDICNSIIEEGGYDD